MTSPRSLPLGRVAPAAALLLVLVAGLAAPRPSVAGGSLPDPLLSLPWEFGGPLDDDFVGAVIAPAGDVNGDGFGDVLVGGGAEDTARVRAWLFLGGKSGLSATPAWSYLTSHADIGNVAPAGDVNGDGYDDVAVGFHAWSSPQHVRVGRVAIFHGGPGGLPPAPSQFLLSPEPNAEQQFGYAVDTAGDVDGDGFDDVIVGAPQYADATYPTRGAAWVFLGGAGGLATTPDTKLESLAENGRLGHSVATAGDVNADGYADVIAGAPLSNYAGASSGGVAQVHVGSPDGIVAAARVRIAGEGPGSQGGSSVSTAGDVDGDGYSDVLVSSPLYQNQSGRVRLMWGSNLVIDGGVLVPDPAFGPLEYFGLHVAPLGDLDGDGYADFGVKARHVAGGGIGRVGIYLGGKNGIVHFGDAQPVEGGHAVYAYHFATAGDVDGDGRAEVLVGDPFADGSRGRVRMRVLPRRHPVLSANWPRVGAQPGSGYGSALAIVPRFEDDDRPRLLIGDPGYDGFGRVSRHLGILTFGVDVDELLDDNVGSSNAQALGARVVDAGDMDRDGYTDFAVSSPGMDIGGTFQAGRVDLLRGFADAPAPEFIVLLGGNSDFDHLGSALAGRGDVNGDGYHDLLVGAREWDSASTQDVGKVWLLLGGPSGFGQWTREGDVYGRGLGAAVALTDLDADGYSDVVVGSSTPEGLTPVAPRVEVHYGGPGGPSNVPGLVLLPPSPSPTFGSVVVALGDVNGDGVADLGVGAPRENDRGVVRIYEGTRGRSQSRIPIRTLIGTQDLARFGEAMSGGGDVDGDGFGDLVVGEPGWDGGQQDEGRMHLYYGARFAPESAPGFVFESDIAGAALGASFAPLRDATADGFADVIAGAPGAAGRVYPFLGGGGPGRSHELHFRDLLPTIQRRFAPARLDQDQGVLAGVGISLAGGRTKAVVDVEIRPFHEPFQRVPTSSSLPNDTGEADIVPLWYEAVGPVPPQPGRGLHLRARLSGGSPYFPRSRWLTTEAHQSGDVDFRLAGAVVDAGPRAPATDAAGVARLSAIAPNPARGATASRLELVLPRPGRVTLDLYDVRGARVRRLVDAALPAGTASYAWDGRDDRGRSVPSGLYFVELAVEGRRDRARLVRLP